LERQFKNSNNTEIVITGITPQNVHSLLQLIYLGSVKLQESQWKNFEIGARILGIDFSFTQTDIENSYIVVEVPSSNPLPTQSSQNHQDLLNVLPMKRDFDIVRKLSSEEKLTATESSALKIERVKVRKNYAQLRNKAKRACQFCKQMYVNKMTHEKNCHKNPEKILFTCQICNAIYCRQETLEKHILKLHVTPSTKLIIEEHNLNLKSP
jgi:hypothetical protein